MKLFSLSAILFSLLLLFEINLSAQNGYNIDIKVNGLSEAQVILGHYFGGPMYPDDTISLDKNGFGVFSSSEKLQQGLYFMYFEDGKFFDIIMGEEQQFSLETDTIDFLQNLKFSGSPDNIIFQDFQLYRFAKQAELKELQAIIQETDNKKEKEKIQNKIYDLGRERLAKINAIADENPDLFVGTFLKATLDIEVPENLKDDSELAFRYYKDHYFDNLNLSDLRLLYTPVYETRLTNYMDKVVMQIPDSLIAEIDIIIEKTRTDSMLFMFVLRNLFNKYGKSQYMGMDAVQVHLADKYYIPEAWWADEKFMSDLKERVAILKPLLIGQTAPDIQLRYVPEEHFKQAANDTALKRYPHAGSFIMSNSVKAEYTVLIFWEATCGHCKKEITKLYKIYEESLKTMNVEVLSVCTLFGSDGKEKWIDFVNSKGLYEWVNAWNPYDYKYKEVYDVRTVPQIFVLDENKEIIGKKLGAENIVDLIAAHKKFYTEN